MKHFIKSKEGTILAITVLMIVVITAINPVFIRIDNLMVILKSNAVLGILACAMMLAIITGGIDLSISSVIAACTVIAGSWLVNVSQNIPLVFLVSIVSGGIMGLINGLLIAKIKIPPFVATLAVGSIINGLMMYLTGGKWITDVPQNFLDFGRTRLLNISTPTGMTGIPIQIFFTIFVAILTWFILRRTLFGRSLYAIGGNVTSAKRIGYNVDKSLILLYTYIGLLAGLAAVVHNSIMVQVDPSVFTGFELEVVAAVVIGGVSIMGGYGRVLGVMIGVVFLSASNNGLILMKIPTFWQQIVVGLIIVAAVTADVVQANRIEKRRTRVDVE